LALAAFLANLSALASASSASKILLLLSSSFLLILPTPLAAPDLDWILLVSCSSIASYTVSSSSASLMTSSTFFIFTLSAISSRSAVSQSSTASSSDSSFFSTLAFATGFFSVLVTLDSICYTFSGSSSLFSSSSF
jgi:hypothetical protein